MQTFVPYPDLARSAHVLDRQRLGKQRVEAKQILRANCGLTKGWVNHPAARMWRGYEGALAVYGIQCCIEWTSRGYVDNLRPEFTAFTAAWAAEGGKFRMPPWWGGPIHATHQAALIRKLPENYAPLFGDVPDVEYFWPVAA